MININLLFFIYTTFGFLFINVLIAWVPSASLILLAVRDAWMIIFLIILIKKNETFYVFFLVSYLLLGIIGIVNIGINSSSIIVYVYGARDLFLIVMFFYFLKQEELSFKVSHVWFFVYFVLVLSMLEIIAFYAGIGSTYRNVFQIEQYFLSKGIISNLNGGLLGVRLSIPFYSPALVCSLFSLLIFIKTSAFKKILYLIVSFYTSSKILMVVLLFKLSRKLAIFILPSIGGGLFVLSQLLPQVIAEYPNSIYSFHAASILDHINALNFFNGEFFSLVPKLLGESSIASLQILGKSDIDGPESLLIARLLDFKLLSIGLVLLFIKELLNSEFQHKIYIMLFCTIIMFSSLSNHPVAYLPFLLLLANEKAYSASKK